MTGKLFGLLAAAILFTSQATSYGGWCRSSSYCCVSHHCCYIPRCCCYYPPCPPCPPCPPRAWDCVHNSTNRWLTVTVTHSGGTESRKPLSPGAWFYFSFDPTRQREATVTAYDYYTGQFVHSGRYLLLVNPPAPRRCIHIGEHYAPGAYPADERMPLPEGEQSAPAPGAPQPQDRS